MTSSADPLAYIFANLRQRDLDELTEFGHTPEQAEYVIRNSGAHFFQMWASKKSKKPVCFLSFHRLTPVALATGFFATDEWPHVARQVYRCGVKYIKPHLLGGGFLRAECRVMEGHDDAVSMLEHFGFKAEARLAHYGATGKAFWQYAWTADAHAYENTPKRQQRQYEREGLRQGADSPNEGMARTGGVGIAGAETTVH